METGRYDSRLQCRIFPSALNRNREASFPPIASSSSCSFVHLDFFLWFVLETAFPSELAGLSFFILHSPFSNEGAGKLQLVRQGNNICSMGSLKSKKGYIVNLMVCMCTHLTTPLVWWVVVWCVDLLLTWEGGKLQAVDGTANISWASWTQRLQHCLVWDAHPPTALLRIIYYYYYYTVETHKNPYEMCNQLQSFLSPFLSPWLKFESGPSSLWLEPLD